MVVAELATAGATATATAAGSLEAFRRRGRRRRGPTAWCCAASWRSSASGCCPLAVAKRIAPWRAAQRPAELTVRFETGSRRAAPCARRALRRPVSAEHAAAGPLRFDPAYVERTGEVDVRPLEPLPRRARRGRLVSAGGADRSSLCAALRRRRRFSRLARAALQQVGQTYAQFATMVSALAQSGVAFAQLCNYAPICPASRRNGTPSLEGDGRSTVTLMVSLPTPNGIVLAGDNLATIEKGAAWT